MCVAHHLFQLSFLPLISTVLNVLGVFRDVLRLNERACMVWVPKLGLKKEIKTSSVIFVCLFVIC